MGNGNISQQSSSLPPSPAGPGSPSATQTAGSSTDIQEEWLLLGMLNSLSLSHGQVLALSGGQNLSRASGAVPGPGAPGRAAGTAGAAEAGAGDLSPFSRV